MRITVVGAGGVGAVFGAALHEAAADITFLVRGSQLRAMCQHGLRISGVRGDKTLAEVNATEDPHSIGTVDVVLLTVKLWDVADAIRQIAPLVGPGTIILTLQNGIDAPDDVASVYGANRVAAGSCFVNASIAEPGVIAQRSPTQKIIAGMLDRSSSPTLEAFAALCRSGEIECELTTAASEMLWEKFVHLVPVSSMTALLRGSMGTIRADPGALEMLDRIFAETVAVGRSIGIEITEAALQRRRDYIANMPANATASMATDLQAGRRLELPWFSGRVASLGRKQAIPTPVCDFINVALKPFVGGAASAA